MRLLIVGAGGMLGSDVVAEAQRRGHDLVALEGRTALDITNLNDVKACLAVNRPETVINCAAWTNVDGAESEPEAAWRLNALGAAHLAAACAETNSWLLQISTDFVFDGTKGSAYHEFDPVNPQSVYGASKEAGERLVRQCLPSRHMIARTSFLYGKQGKNLVDTIVRAAKSRPSLTFVEDQLISPTSTVDLARVLLDLATDPLPGTYHVANAGQCSLLEFARFIVAEAGLSTPVLATTFAEYVATAKPAASRPQVSPLERRMLALRGMDTMPDWKDALKAYLVP
ncbi:dTDP-4-dehydrorhamnose reductase [Armatimonas sp.]|uniref:dTDP-4-dehydrorhamnose reductase n=1 Tax=Armatimonas sp. TaxID=1872638 RepID=UPI00286A4753|nr:dTDP-4-dehydrorhamnose reductase [Armatimonas sp.]